MSHFIHSAIAFMPWMQGWWWWCACVCGGGGGGGMKKGMQGLGINYNNHAIMCT